MAARGLCDWIGTRIVGLVERRREETRGCGGANEKVQVLGRRPVISFSII
jgi:hypothetical protein